MDGWVRERGSWYVDRNHGVLPACMVAWFHWTMQEKTTITIISNQHLTEMRCCYVLYTHWKCANMLYFKAPKWINVNFHQSCNWKYTVNTAWILMTPSQHNLSPMEQWKVRIPCFLPSYYLYGKHRKTRREGCVGAIPNKTTAKNAGFFKRVYIPCTAKSRISKESQPFCCRWITLHPLLAIHSD